MTLQTSEGALWGKLHHVRPESLESHSEWSSLSLRWGRGTPAVLSPDFLHCQSPRRKAALLDYELETES